MNICIRFGLILVALTYSFSLQAADFFFKDGDVVVMIGDSITEQHLYSNYVEMWTVTRFPKWKLTFRNVGIGGDRSVGGNTRFARDVLSHKPTAMTVDFGMNDGGYRAFGDDTFNPYMNGLQGMASQAKLANIRVAWITPQPLDTADQGSTALVGYNQTLEKFSEGVKAIAEKNEGLFVDQFHPYLNVLDAARSKSPKYERITGGDAVHPGPAGQALMAASILKGLSFPTLVSAADIDASGKVITTNNCTIIDAVTKDGSLTFVRMDSALPFFPADATGILSSTPILEELNQYTLKVTGLNTGKYEVRIGGKKLTEFRSEELAAGVNLASHVLSTGPIAEKIKTIRSAIEAKNRYHHDMIFRGVVLSNVAIPEWLGLNLTSAEIEAKRQSVIKERSAKMLELDAQISKSLELQGNVFEVIPVK